MPVISEEEKRRRLQVVESVIGTNTIAGIELDAATHEIFQRFASGDLTLDQFSAAMDAHALELVAAHRDLQRAATTLSLLQ
jgi:hypothetical protein